MSGQPRALIGRLGADLAAVIRTLNLTAPQRRQLAIDLNMALNSGNLFPVEAQRVLTDARTLLQGSAVNNPQGVEQLFAGLTAMVNQLQGSVAQARRPARAATRARPARPANSGWTKRPRTNRDRPRLQRDPARAGRDDPREVSSGRKAGKWESGEVGKWGNGKAELGFCGRNSGERSCWLLSRDGPVKAPRRICDRIGKDIRSGRVCELQERSPMQKVDRRFHLHCGYRCA